MNDATRDNPAVAAEAAATNPNGKRKKLLATVIGAFVAAGLAYGAYWAIVARHVESTDDAYVDGNVVQITSQIAGTVIAIHADDTEFVRTGEELVQLDRADAAVALRGREARLAQTVREVRNLFANTAQLKAAVAGREVDLAKVRGDLARREKLANSGAISTEDVQHARDAVRGAESALAAAREQLAANRALTDDTSVAAHPSVEQAAAQVRAAYLEYQRTMLPAPVSGIVAKRSVQLGQRVRPGTPLMAIVPLDEVWVDANFKEGQLKDIRIGQPVRLTADANGVEYYGRVIGFDAGTGAAFALLPAQNATGNWIKVVQRLPVRIALDQKELEAHPLAIGLSMEVEVDVHQKNGAQRVQVADADPTYRTAVFARQERAVDDLIADIIMQNGGGPNANLPRLAATRPLLRASTDQLGSAERAGSSAR
jgi:membrane fusion protein, multidrug efflux system